MVPSCPLRRNTAYYYAKVVDRARNRLWTCAVFSTNGGAGPYSGKCYNAISSGPCRHSSNSSERKTSLARNRWVRLAIVGGSSSLFVFRVRVA
jgi:hypothetical protein